MPDCCDSSSPYHAPDFVRAAPSSCDKYRAWLDGVAATAKNAGTKGAKRAIHDAVLQHGEYDFYTGQKLEWNRINHIKPSDTGWRAHKIRGKYPSADHYNGTKLPDFRICSAQVNWAKGSLSHDQFVELCEEVADHWKTSGRRRKGK